MRDINNELKKSFCQGGGWEDLTEDAGAYGGSVGKPSRSVSLGKESERRDSTDSVKGMKNIMNNIEKQENPKHDLMEELATDKHSDMNRDQDGKEDENQLKIGLRFREVDGARSPLPAFQNMMSPVSKLQKQKLEYQNR